MLSKDFEIDVSDIIFFEEEIKSVESEGQLLQMNVNPACYKRPTTV